MYVFCHFESFSKAFFQSIKQLRLMLPAFSHEQLNLPLFPSAAAEWAAPFHHTNTRTMLAPE